MSFLGLSATSAAAPQVLPTPAGTSTRVPWPAIHIRGGATPLVAPANDLCTAPTAIPSTGGLVPFTTTEATQTTGQGQNSGCGAINKDVWFSWTAPNGAGVATIETCGLTGVDTVLAVYNGTACPGTSTAVTCNNDGCGSQSKVSFNFTAGQAFLVQLGSPGTTPPGGTGQLRLTYCIQRNRAGCGSLLVFPEYDNTSGQKTLYTITNAVCDPSVPVFLQNVIIEVVYVHGSTCTESNYTFTLTPYDTVSHLTNVQLPSTDRGYLYAFAKNCQTGPLDTTCPIVFNSLIGMETVLNGITNFDYSLNAIAFRGLGVEGSLNDDGSRPGIRELDDVNEYEGAPNEILIPRFLGQDNPNLAPVYNVNSSLIFLSLSTTQPIQLAGFVNTNNLAANPPSVTKISFNTSFTCWEKRALNNLEGLGAPGATDNTTSLGVSGSGNEIIGGPVIGADPLRTGWISLDASNPDVAFYAVLVEKAGAGTQQSAADLPFEYCSQGDGRVRPTNP